MQDRIKQAYLTTPPLTRMYLTASVVLTTLSTFLSPHPFPPALTYLTFTEALTKPWSLATTFLNLGGFGISYALTLQFLWTYMSQIERLHLHSPASFLVLLTFGPMALTTMYFVLGLR